MHFLCKKSKICSGVDEIYVPPLEELFSLPDFSVEILNVCINLADLLLVLVLFVIFIRIKPPATFDRF